MKWKSPLANEYPAVEKEVLIEFYSGDYESRFIGVLDEMTKRWWDKNVKRWLDESLPPSDIKKITEEAERLYPYVKRDCSYYTDDEIRLRNIKADAHRYAHISAAKMYIDRIRELEAQVAYQKQQLEHEAEAYNKLYDQAEIWREESGGRW